MAEKFSVTTTPTVRAPPSSSACPQSPTLLPSVWPQERYRNEPPRLQTRIHARAAHRRRACCDGLRAGRTRAQRLSRRLLRVRSGCTAPARERRISRHCVRHAHSRRRRRRPGPCLDRATSPRSRLPHRFHYRGHRQRRNGRHLACNRSALRGKAIPRATVHRCGLQDDGESAVNNALSKEDLRIRLLIVDDEQSIRKLCVTVGEALGFICMEAESGDSALALLEEQPAHRALTDMVIPHMSGLEFLEKVKKLLPRSEVALIPRHGSIPTPVHPINLGPYAYTPTPFSPLDTLLL